MKNKFEPKKEKLDLEEMLAAANLEIIELDQAEALPSTAASSGSSSGNTCSTCGSSSSSTI
ncbi:MULTISPECIES: thiazolylpeptide-type bacteriocin [Bacillus]|nr:MULTISPECIES: thiazolylpeptide-type bacteriocin [Bacillus cereus group]MBE7148413.1 thiazolylpeptide-type bacteriocin [Bacillus mycoides]PEP21568.1 thiazolylpeptide-type bacteriocin [Bacillus wiedmannii]